MPSYLCPQCQQPSSLTVENTFRPFCSHRCQLIDLGQWAAEEHKIQGAPLTDLDQLDALPTEAFH